MIDLSLYLVTDRSLSQGRSTVNVVRAAVRGGVTCVQTVQPSAPGAGATMGQDQVVVIRGDLVNICN